MTVPSGHPSLPVSGPDGGGRGTGRRLGRVPGPGGGRRGHCKPFPPGGVEERRVLAGPFASRPANPGKNVVQFGEDIAGASDQLYLTLSSGLLGYRWNG